MADWRSDLTFSTRFENVQKIASATGAEPQDALALETDSYNSSDSLSRAQEQYNDRCFVAAGDGRGGGGPGTGPNMTDPGLSTTTTTTTATITSLTPPEPESPGLTIGSYHGCHFIASGATSAVYRSKAVALKVIVETHNIDPHNPVREAKILAGLKEPCIPLLETFRDQEQRLTLAFPFMPLGLDQRLQGQGGPLSREQIRSHFRDLFRALDDLHGQDIIHRDIKPSAVLLKSPDGPAYLSDFGTAWHPDLSPTTEPWDDKILDIGTGPYRAPEVLFGDKSYGTAVDMWGAGAMFAEACRFSSSSSLTTATTTTTTTPYPLFESRPVHEDGNQLGLILSIFKTIGSPTRESWPEAAHFRTPPFDIYRVFPPQSWEQLLPEDIEPDFRAIIEGLVKYESGSRLNTKQALESLERNM